jgi:hypothetical protein
MVLGSVSSSSLRLHPIPLHGTVLSEVHAQTRAHTTESCRWTDLGAALARNKKNPKTKNLAHLHDTLVGIPRPKHKKRADRPPAHTRTSGAMSSGVPECQQKSFTSHGRPYTHMHLRGHEQRRPRAPADELHTDGPTHTYLGGHEQRRPRAPTDVAAGRDLLAAAKVDRRQPRAAPLAGLKRRLQSSQELGFWL